MKKIILSILFLAFVSSGFAQGVVPVSTNLGKLPYLDLLQVYRTGSDSSLIELYQDTVKFRTNQAAYSFNKELYVKGINVAEGGSIIINNDTVLSLDTANIVYKSTIDTIFAKKTFLTSTNGSTGAIFKSTGYGTPGATFIGTNFAGLSVQGTSSGNPSMFIDATGASAKGLSITSVYSGLEIATTGNDQYAAFVETSGYRAIPLYFHSVLCDTLFRIDKGATKILTIENSENGCLFKTNKTYFDFDKRTYGVGFTSQTGGNGIISNTTDTEGFAIIGNTSGPAAYGGYFETSGDQSSPIVCMSTNTDTILQLHKSTINVLNIANSTSSVKLNSEKDLFEFNKHIATVEVTKSYQTLTYAASVTMNTNIGANAKITLTGACALTLSNLTNGDEGNIIVTQDATGSRAITISPTPKVINGGSGVVTLSTTANSIDIISYTYDGTNLYINYGKNYN